MIASGRANPLLMVENLRTFLPTPKGFAHAVDGISFILEPGRTLGLVGESGCGKTMTAYSVMSLLPRNAVVAKESTIEFRGQNLVGLPGAQLRRILGKDIAMIFQDAAASLNPVRKIGKTISEPLRTIGEFNRQNRTRMVRELMQEVGLDPDQVYERRPFEFFVGQCQRISIARVLITNPSFLIFDEPVSSLDVSVQAQILNLLESIKARHGLTMLFISHDLAVVKNISDRVAVMYLGKLCEIADSEDLYRTPRHPYTALFLESIPEPDPIRIKKDVNLQSGEIPSPASPPIRMPLPDTLSESTTALLG